MSNLTKALIEKLKEVLIEKTGAGPDDEFIVELALNLTLMTMIEEIIKEAPKREPKNEPGEETNEIMSELRRACVQS